MENTSLRQSRDVRHQEDRKTMPMETKASKQTASPFTWQWIKWEMATLLFCCFFLIFTSKDKWTQVWLVPLMPILFKLAYVWRGLNDGESSQSGGPNQMEDRTIEKPE